MALFEHSELYFWRNGSLVERCGTNEKGHDKMKRERERKREEARRVFLYSSVCVFVCSFVCLSVCECVLLCVMNVCMFEREEQYVCGLNVLRETVCVWFESATRNSLRVD